MGSAVDRLLKFVESDRAFNTPYSEILPLQIEAANERLQEQVGKIRLLGNRASSSNTTKISAPADLVPLLFAHTAYKSYSESWLADGRWDRMGKWLETVSTNPVDNMDLSGIKDLDDWIDRLETVGHYVTCSSGTTGKPAILTCSQADLTFTTALTIRSFSWALKVEPAGDFKLMGMGSTSKAARTEAFRLALVNAFCSPETAYLIPGPPITVGQIAAMIALRRKIADGTASPGEIEAFENLSKSRQTAFTEGMAEGVREFLKCRDQKMLISGMWATLYGFAAAVKAQGFSGKDFSPQNLGLVAGGLKGNQLPPDFKEVIFETFNLKTERLYQIYSMQEINSQFPLCRAGRYHIPAWVMLLMLNESGEVLLDTSGDAEVEGRAAFFDVSLDARWGGIISGDKIKAHFGKCACGEHGPTVGPEIVRYSDLASGDKLACSGTIDAYIKGVT